MRSGRKSVTWSYGNGVAITLPVDVAIDAAESIGDAGSVVGVGRQGAQMGSFLAKPVERALTVTLAWVDDAIHPVGELERGSRCDRETSGR